MQKTNKHTYTHAHIHTSHVCITFFYLHAHGTEGTSEATIRSSVERTIRLMNLEGLAGALVGVGLSAEQVCVHLAIVYCIVD